MPSSKEFSNRKLQKNLKQAKVILLGTHQGMSASKLQSLRKELALLKVEYRALSKSRVQRALIGTPFADLLRDHKGGIALAFVYENPLLTVPPLLTLSRRYKEFVLIKACFQKQILSIEELSQTLSPTPSDQNQTQPRNPPRLFHIEAKEILSVSAKTLEDLCKQLRPYLAGPPPQGQKKTSWKNPTEVLHEILSCKQELVQTTTEEKRLHLSKRIDFLKTIHAALRDGNTPAQIDPLVTMSWFSYPWEHPAPDGWTYCQIDQEALLSCCTGLWLQKGFRLSAYAFREGDNGNGVVWALPKEASIRALVGEPGRLFVPPRPALSLPLAQALHGDKSLLSYLHTSLLLRETSEFAALWHGVSWREHQIVEELPKEPWEPIPLPKIEKISPRVYRNESGVFVVFYSLTRLGNVRLLEHVDHYTEKSYVPTKLSQETLVATAGFGYVH